MKKPPGWWDPECAALSKKYGPRKMGGCLGRDPTAIQNPFKESQGLSSNEVYDIIGIHEGLSSNDALVKASCPTSSKEAASREPFKQANSKLGD
jgi:hypothetical protein